MSSAIGCICKRLFDVMVSGLLLVVLAPILLAVALVVRSKLGSPILFHQRRPGLRGELFTLIKFRTMLDTVSKDGKLLPDGERLTSLGKFLRASSLDELPELWNVLCGEMSLVGPRPLLADYLPRYSAHQARRHEVRPGITGWAQVNGRNALSWEQKFEHDVWYVDHHTFSLDLKILWLTAMRLFRRNQISAPGHATMPPFEGQSDA